MTTDQKRVTTAAERDNLPSGVVIRSADGTIACRHHSGVGVVFGDDRPFPWDVLTPPLTVLYHPAPGRPRSMTDNPTDHENVLITAKQARRLREAATPGPWMSTWEDADGWFSITGAPHDGLVCPEVATVEEHGDHDAALVVAAPDLAYTVGHLSARLADAEARLAQVGEALKRHPAPCDQYPEDGPVSCGWRRAVQDMHRAFSGEDARPINGEVVDDDGSHAYGPSPEGDVLDHASSALRAILDSGVDR